MRVRKKAVLEKVESHSRNLEPYHEWVDGLSLCQALYDPELIPLI